MKQEEFPRLLSPFAFSADSRHFGYLVQQKGRQHVVLDGFRSLSYDRITSGLYFSDCGKHAAFSARQSDREFVVVDGLKEAGLRRGRLADFTPCFRRRAYVAVQNGRSFAVVDGVRGEISTRSSPSSSAPTRGGRPTSPPRTGAATRSWTA
jgi:hypothetical protein